ncbi:RNA polymerase sigma factor [Streptosporangium lutulentum]
MPDTWPLAGPLPATAGVAQPVRSNELAVREDASDDLRRLVLRAKTGDTEAFGTLYDRYLNLVYRYVYFRVGSHPWPRISRARPSSARFAESPTSPGKDVISEPGS